MINGKFIGSGFLAIKDTSGNCYTAGVLQSVQGTLGQTVKKLIGSNKFAVAAAVTEQSITISAKFAQLSTGIFTAMLGASTATGSKQIGTVTKTASSSAFTVANADFGSPTGWTFGADLGVEYASTGQPLKYNSGTLASTGEYKNTAGAYTLGSGDATAQVKVTCLYTQTGGSTATAVNTPIGVATMFTAFVFEQSTQADGTVRQALIQLPAVIPAKYDFNFTNTDFLSQTIELEAFADTAGNVAYIYDI